VELKRPELSEAKWLDKDGNGTGKGLVGEALKLSVVCNADTEEGAGVIFKVYPDGADPRYDQPVAELSSRNGGGKAEAEWTYRYEHDPENPLTEKPKYFFTVNGQRCKEVKSGNVEIGMEIDIPVCFDDGECIEGLEYTLVGQDGTEISEKTGDDGRIKNNSIIPAAYKINIKWDSYAPPDDTGPKFFDLDGTSDGVSKIYLSYRNDETTLELRPGQNYIIVVDKNGDSVST
jgi:hypothetical protein